MKRKLTPLEFEELCDLFNKCGETDVLDFIHFIQESARKFNYSQAKIKEILIHAPEDREHASRN